MSSSVLYQRLTELTEAGLIAKNDSGDYILTPLGEELYPALVSLLKWSEMWAAAEKD